MAKAEVNGNSIHDGIEHAPGGGKALISPNDALLLLLACEYNDAGEARVVDEAAAHNHSLGTQRVQWPAHARFTKLRHMPFTCRGRRELPKGGHVAVY